MSESVAERCRILIIEENVDAADALTMLLEIFGHDVRAVHSGEEGLDAIEADPPELAFVDIGMPGIDGWEVARRVIARMGEKAPMLVAISGYWDAEAIARSLAAGFDRHLGKPLDVEAMQTAICDCVARRPGQVVAPAS